MAMATQERLPPSGRDFAVYQLITVQQMSTREVAEAAQLSQTRICQIVRKTGEFLAEVAPPAREGEKERQIRLGEQIAAERVQFLYGLAVRSFERSQGNQRTERQAAGPLPQASLVMLKSTQGDPRYLMTACRLALAAAKLPAPNLAALVDSEDVADAAPAVACPTAAGPQAGDCSAAGRERPVSTTKSTTEPAAKPVETIPCAENPATAWNQIQHAPPPVQLAELRAQRDVVPSGPLSREQRRARQRSLEQKLKRSRMAG
jgi:hypothetical protein